MVCNSIGCCHLNIVLLAYLISWFVNKKKRKFLITTIPVNILPRDMQGSNDNIDKPLHTCKSDIILVVEGREIEASEESLRCHSHYFKGLFNSPLYKRYSTRYRTELPELSYDAVKDIVNQCCIGDELKLTHSNIQVSLVVVGIQYSTFHMFLFLFCP